MQFEWDEAKAFQNLARHGVDFVDASAVFEDPLRLELQDERYEYGEMRVRAIGIVQGVLLVVVFTYREDTIRIISARKAERHERRAYYESHR